MAHLGIGTEVGSQGQILLYEDSEKTLLTWIPTTRSKISYDEQARLTISHVSDAAGGSLGVRFLIFRVLNAYPVLVHNVVLLDNIAERVVAGPYDSIRIRVVQLGGPGTGIQDQVSAQVIARLEGLAK